MLVRLRLNDFSCVGLCFFVLYWANPRQICIASLAARGEGRESDGQYYAER